MFNRLMQLIVLWLERILWNSGRYIFITGTEANKADIYLIRYFLLKTRWVSIYIHRFMRSDRDDHHDHPFSFLSYIVKGQYTESLLTGYLKSLLFAGKRVYQPEFTRTVRAQGTWAFRKAEAIHQVLLDRDYLMDQRLEAPLTVIFRGPYRREWGFWEPYGQGAGQRLSWTYWREYLGVLEGDVRE